VPPWGRIVHRLFDSSRTIAVFKNGNAGCYVYRGADPQVRPRWRDPLPFYYMTLFGGVRYLHICAVVVYTERQGKAVAESTFHRGANVR